tara:strand:- start:289 stop:468 length:180 start_codon:yes stop_codon:yes gene_type:complete
MIIEMIVGIISWVISAIPKLIVLALIIYVMKMIYDHGVKKWREGFSSIKNKKHKERNCI